MLDGLFMLLALSLVMALSCFLAGALPLSMTLSSSQLRLISTIGMGVLVGTSLIVIIPEGIKTVYSAGLGGHSDLRRGLHIRENGILMRWAPTPAVAHRAEDQLDRSLGAGDTVIPAVIEIKNEATPTSPTVTRENPHGKTEETSPNHQDKEEHHENDPPTFYIGLSLILGFVLMFLVDKLPRHASDNLQSTPTPRHISLDNLSRGLHSSSTLSLEDGESESFLQAIAPTPKQSRSLATTTGLVIHAAADGVAMGASASSARTSLGFIVFIAILVHKAPAAFGLTSVLLKQGLSKRAARGHLIIFSLASPVGSLSTWLLVNLLGGGQLTGEKGQWWTGMLLLFSAGTFLYVAMHAMQEDSAHESSSANGYGESNGLQRKQAKPQMKDTLAAVGGMLIPLLTQLGHHH